MILGVVTSNPVEVEVPAELVRAPLVKVIPFSVVVLAAVVTGRVREMPVTDWAALVTLVERSIA